MIDPALLELLTLTKITHDGTLPSIIQATQKHWLRKPGTERWEIETAYEHLKPLLMPLFQKLGMIDEIKPTQTTYDYALVFGGLQAQLENRYSLALDLWKQGIRYKRLVFLLGDRPLNPKKEELIHHPYSPKTEADIARIIFEQTDLPPAFNAEIAFISYPMKKTGRPTTADTVLKWLSTHPTPGPIIALSNQPFVDYQQAVLSTLLPKNFIIETVGNKAQEAIPVGEILDTLTRKLYQETKFQKLK